MGGIRGRGRGEVASLVVPDALKRGVSLRGAIGSGVLTLRGATWAAVVCATLSVALFGVWVVCGWGGEFVVTAVDDVGLMLFAIFAAGCSVFAAVRNRGRQRAAWIFMSVGLAGWAIGEGIWSYYELVLGVEEELFPSLADVGYVVFPVAACLGLLLLPLGFQGRSQVRLVLDGIIVEGSIFIVSWAVVLGDVVATSQDTPFATALSLAYAVADMVIVTIAILVMARARTSQRAAVLLLTVGMVCIAVSDTAFVHLVAKDMIATGDYTLDIGWAAGFALLGIAALLGARPASSTPPVADMPRRSRCGCRTYPCSAPVWWASWPCCRRRPPTPCPWSPASC